MVYCDLINVTGSQVFYKIGGYSNDLSGSLIVDTKKGKYVIAKQPEHSKVYDYHVRRMIRKAQNDYDKGIFKKHLSYEIG